MIPELCIADGLKINKNKDLVSKNGPMEQFFKDNGKKAKQMVKENLSIQMEIFMMENGFRIKLKD